MFQKWNALSLVKRIIIGLVLGVLLALFMPHYAAPVGILGDLFVGALKAIAPILVFFLVISAISQAQASHKTYIKSIMFLYMLGTFLAGLVAVAISFIFPVTIKLTKGIENVTPPSDIVEVLKNLLMNAVDNPVSALANANYIGVLAWALVIGFALKNAPESTKVMITDFSNALTLVVKWIIDLAPFGIMGLVFATVSEQGISTLLGYGQLLALLVGSMAIMALVVNPFIAYMMMRINPYPLVFKCLKESGLTAFFTRSSAANIPVNMALCEDLKLDKDVYSVSIPLGATVNMTGAAITITVLTLAAVNTLGISVDFGTALLLSIVAAVSASGASGVAGGSLLLIPLACSLFGIPDDVAMQVVAVGFVIGVIQDSVETALNSSTDVLFTAVSEFRQWRKSGREIVID